MRAFAHPTRCGHFPPDPIKNPAPPATRATPDACHKCYAAPERLWLRIGRLRKRLPVAAKMAFVTAGWIMVAPGSPTPPHFLPGVGVRSTSVLGASLRR